MQAYGEWAMREHRAPSCKPQFFKDIKDKKNRPFDFRVTKDEVDGIMSTAMKRSDRYHIADGQATAATAGARPAISRRRCTKGRRCTTATRTRADCDTWWPVLSERKCSRSSIRR